MSFLADAKKLREEKERDLRAVPDDGGDPFGTPPAPDAGLFDTPAAPGAGEGAGRGYAGTALDREAAGVAGAPEGTRNDALNKAAFSLGGLVAGGELDEATVVQALTDAARTAGLDEREIPKTIASGLSKGKLNPRTAPRNQILGGVYETREQAEASFTEPDPIGGAEQPVRPFPLDTYPARFADYIAAVAASTQTPPEMVAMIGLSVLSAAAANRVWISRGGDWLEPATIWTLTVMPSGSRKSPVMRAVTRPLHTLEREIREASEQANAGKEDLRIAAEKRREAAMTKLAKASSKAEREEQQAELEAARADIEDNTVTPPERFVISDVTPEALGMVMAANNGHIGLFSAEGGTFGLLAGRYTNGQANLDLFLMAADGDYYSADRVGRDRVVIEQPALSMALAVQPDVLAETVKTPALKERGLMGRFLYAVPETTVGSRAIDAPAVPEQLHRDWYSLVSAITNLPVCTPDQPRRIITLDDDARDAHRDFQAALEPRMHPKDGDLAFMADFVGKLAGKVLRLAALFHLAAGHGTGDPVDILTMRAAICTGYWALDQAVNVYGGWRSPEADIAAARVLEWIRRKQPAEFTVRDVYNALRGQTWCATADNVRDALVTLGQAGWITSVQRLMADGKRTLKDGAFIPHPSLMEDQP